MLGRWPTSLRGFPPEATEARTGVPAGRVRQLARDLATAPSAAVYGRTGSCLGRYGTLVAYLLDALNVVTGNLDRPGGAVFGTAPIPVDDVFHLVGAGSYDKARSRVGGFPDVLGSFPAGVMAKEITTPGPGQLRALFVSAGNPVLSVPNAAELTAALPQLDLMVSIDLYVNDTNRHADYVLPATTWLEREDFPLPFMIFHLTPFAQWTDPVVAPYGEARQEWEIIEALSRRLGITPNSVAAARLAGRLGVRLTPKQVIGLALSVGSRGRLSLGKLRRHPHGIVLGESIQTGVLDRKVRHRGKKVRLDAPAIVAEIARLARAEVELADPAYPLRLIGLRELRSHNSWMHNAPTLMKGQRAQAARVHPKDAAEAGVENGTTCRIASPYGSVDVLVRVTDEVVQGTVAVPHGWGHAGGGWRRANAAGGANVNQLASSDPADLEPLAGMAHLNGIPVSLSPAG